MTPILSATLLRTQSDSRLLSLAQKGHSLAFEAIVERHRRAMLRQCRRVLPDARADDAVQRACVNAWLAIGAGAEIRELEPWLLRVARNAALDGRKHAGYDYEELRDSLRLAPSADAQAERRAVMRETLRAIAALPDAQREALLRIAVQGQTSAEAARDLGLSDGAVRQLLHRARLALRATATAVTPLPLVRWAAAGGAGAERIGEAAAGAGAAGAAWKAGVAVLAGAAILTVGGAVERAPSQRSTPEEDSRSAARPAERSVSALAGPVGAGPGKVSASAGTTTADQLEPATWLVDSDAARARPAEDGPSTTTTSAPQPPATRLPAPRRRAALAPDRPASDSPRRRRPPAEPAPARTPPPEQPTVTEPAGGGEDGGSGTPDPLRRRP